MEVNSKMLAQIAEKFADTVHTGGALLISGTDKPNAMTIGWGTVGVMWYKPVFMLAVRRSRYSLKLLEQCGEFTVYIPAEGEMQQELKFCGTRSGRDTDKIAESGLKCKKAQTVQVPALEGKGMVIEGKICGESPMGLAGYTEEILQRYKDGDEHIYLFGEITACY